MKKKTLIAVVLNALVLPGVGHIYIGLRVRGTVLALLTVFFVVAPIAKYAMLMSYALNSMTVITSGAAANFAFALSSMWPAVKNAVILAAVAIAVIWVFGIYDVYVKSKAQILGVKA